MVTLTERSSIGVNAISIGVIADDVSSAAANADRLNDWATQGYSIYFPPGSYYVDRETRWTNKENIKVWGDAARIYQTTDNTDGSSRIFRFDDCNKVEVSGLTFHTAYYLARTSVTGSSRTSCIYTEECKSVHIHDNTFEGFQCHCIRLNGDEDVRVCDNTFRDGHWDPLNNETTNTACILNWISSTNVRSKRVMITGNSCNTLALHSVLAQHAIEKLIVANNSCIATDENGNTIRSYTALQPKAGIEIQYETDASGGYTGADTEEYDQMIVTGNNIQGCRFAGISGQSSSRPNALHPGIRGILANNTIKYCGTDIGAGITSNLMGGIIWVGYRDLLVNSNVITDIPNDGGSNGTSAISIQGIWARVDGAGDTSTPTSCIVSNNIISNCRSRGIYITSQGTAASNNSGDVNICNNMIQDIDGAEAIRVLVPANTYRSGYVHINENRISSTKTVGTYVLRVEVGTTNPAECTISNNTINYRDATFTVATRPLIEVQVTKAIISGNRLISDGTNGIGINFATLVTGQRFDQLIIADNQIDSCNFGVASSNAPTYGPFLLSNTTLTNCNTPIEEPTSMKHGHWENGKAIMYEDVDPTVTAPEGNYLAGDMIWNTAASGTGDVMGWVSTGSGGWAPMVQIP